MSYDYWKALHDDAMLSLFFNGKEEDCEILDWVNRLELDYPNHLTTYLRGLNK